MPTKYEFHSFISVCASQNLNIFKLEKINLTSRIIWHTKVYIECHSLYGWLVCSNCRIMWDGRGQHQEAWQMSPRSVNTLTNAEAARSNVMLQKHIIDTTLIHYLYKSVPAPWVPGVPWCTWWHYNWHQRHHSRWWLSRLTQIMLNMRK